MHIIINILLFKCRIVLVVLYIIYRLSSQLIEISVLVSMLLLSQSGIDQSLSICSLPI